jgi:hypothetical protein
MIERRRFDLTISQVLMNPAYEGRLYVGWQNRGIMVYPALENAAYGKKTKKGAESQKSPLRKGGN